MLIRRKELNKCPSKLRTKALTAWRTYPLQSSVHMFTGHTCNPCMWVATLNLSCAFQVEDHLAIHDLSFLSRCHLHKALIQTTVCMETADSLADCFRTRSQDYTRATTLELSLGDTVELHWPGQGRIPFDSSLGFSQRFWLLLLLFVYER